MAVLFTLLLFEDVLGDGPNDAAAENTKNAFAAAELAAAVTSSCGSSYAAEQTTLAFSFIWSSVGRILAVGSVVSALAVHLTLLIVVCSFLVSDLVLLSIVVLTVGTLVVTLCVASLGVLVVIWASHGDEIYN